MSGQLVETRIDAVPDVTSVRLPQANSLAVVRLASPEAISAIAKEWEALEALSTPRTPFSSPLWASLWWKHFRRDDLFVRDEFLVLAVRSSNSRLVAVAPFFRRSAPSIAPAIYRTIQFIGADSSITELRGPTCAPEDETRVWHTLRTYFRREFREWDLIQWDGIREQVWHQNSGFRASLPNYFIRLPGSWPELNRQISGNFRRNMRKQRELFEQDRHTYEIHLIDEPAQMGAALDVLFSLHSQRAQVADMDVKHFDRFARPVNRRFLTEYALAMASRKKAHIFELAVNGNTVATQLAFTVGKDLWMYTSGFDPDWRRYGVMTMLTVEVMQWAMRYGYEIVNLSCGSDRGKTRWRPSEVVYSQLLESAPGLRGRLAMQAHETIGLARRLQKRLKGYKLRSHGRDSRPPAHDERTKSERDQATRTERQPPSSFRQSARGAIKAQV